MVQIQKIKKTAGDYEGIDFVLKARMGKGLYPSNRNLENLLFDGAAWWATDGHRLHYYYANNTDMEPGVYRLISKDKNTVVLDPAPEVNYPDITVLSFWRGYDPKWNIGINTKTSKGANLSQSYTKIIRNMEEDETIDFNFLNDLPEDEYTVYSHGARLPLCFANHNKGAVIMPLKV